jgi:hypothetical protein
MRLDELEVKDPQLDEFVGKAVGAVGRGVGKVIGGVAKGVGAVAGVGQGIKKAFQKGKQASIDVIGGTGQGADAQAKPAASGSTSVSNTTSSAPAAASSTGSATSTNAAPETPTSQPAASSATTAPAAQPAAAAPTAQPAATAGATVQNAPQNTDAVSKLQDRIFNLDTDSQRDILQLLQAQSKKPDASAKTTTKPQATAQDQTAKPAANTQPQATSQDQTDTDKSLSPDKFGSMVQNLAQPNAEKTTQTANTGTSTAQPDAQTTSDRPQGGGKVAGQLSTNPRAVKRREQRTAEKQKSIDTDRERLVQTQSDSIQRSTTNMVSESQYQTFSLFRK